MIYPFWYASGGSVSQPIDVEALGNSILGLMGGMTPQVSAQGQTYVRGPRGTLIPAPEQGSVSQAMENTPAPVALVSGQGGTYTSTKFSPLTTNVNQYTVDMPSTANIDALVARANAVKPQAQPVSRANAVKPQAQPVSRATQRNGNMAYTMGPSVTTSATNIPGQVQVNLNQQHMRFADPEYQRLYALQEARAREALARQGVSYPTAMNHAKNGTSY